MKRAANRFFQQQLQQFDSRWTRLTNHLSYQISNIKDVDYDTMDALLKFLFENLRSDLLVKGFISHYEDIFESLKLIFAMINRELNELPNPDNKFHHFYKSLVELLLELAKYALSLELYEVRHNLRGFVNYILSKYYDLEEKRFDYECLLKI